MELNDQKAPLLAKQREKGIQVKDSSETRLAGDDLEDSKRPSDLGDDWEYVSSKNQDKRSSHSTSDFDTFVHLLKGNVGTGILALPYATMEAGYILGPLGVLLFGTIATHCMVLLVESARALCQVNNISALDYSETMQFAILRSGAWPRISKASKVMVNMFLIVTQFGFCSVYFVFIAKSLQQVMSDIFCADLNFRLWVLIILVPIILFSWIRNLDTLASLSFLANICILLGLVIIGYDELYKLVTNGKHEAAVKEGNLDSTGGPLKLAMFFGTAVFAFEAIGVVLPLENKMKQPSHAKAVLYVGMGIITVLNAGFGLLGYLVYGDDIQGSITLNLCGTNAITAFVFSMTKILFALNIFVSYLIQFYVPLDFLEPYLYKLLRINSLHYKYPDDDRYYERAKGGAQLVFRSLLVIMTACLAVSIPDLEDLITLVGAGCSSSLAFIFPPLIEMLTFGNDKNRKFLRVFPRPVWIVKDLAIMSLGIVGFMFGTFAAVKSVVGTLEHPSKGMECNSPEDFQTYCHLI